MTGRSIWRHYEVSLFAMFQGMSDFDGRGWKIGLPPCCCCNECQSAYATGWAIMKNDAMFPQEEKEAK